MSPVPVVEQLDVIEDGSACFIAGEEAAMMHELVLEIAEEAFDHGVVVAIAFAAHADSGANPFQPSLIVDADIG